MSTERIDLGEMLIAKNDDLAPGHVLFGRPDAAYPSTRFIEAFTRGEVTEGGMAEAGWVVVGKFQGDGPKINSLSVKGLDNEQRNRDSGTGPTYSRPSAVARVFPRTVGRGAVSARRPHSIGLSDQMSDQVRNFLEQDKALCSQALDGDRGVLLRAAEMLSRAQQQPAPESDDPT